MMQDFSGALIIITIMVIIKCNFSREHIALSVRNIEKRCDQRIRKNQQIKGTVHDAK